MFNSCHRRCWQVEQELAAERVAAEAEAKRAQEAIQAKQQELQQIEQQRQHEVNNHLSCVTTHSQFRSSVCSEWVCILHMKFYSGRLSCPFVVIACESTLCTETLPILVRRMRQGDKLRWQNSNRQSSASLNFSKRHKQSKKRKHGSCKIPQEGHLSATLVCMPHHCCIWPPVMVVQ